MSTTDTDQAYVWVWLPGHTTPVVAGVLHTNGDLLTFTYGRSYLAQHDAIALYLPELPLRSGTINPPSGLAVAGVIRDSAPDSWGQRVILARHTGRDQDTADTADLPLLTYLLESGSNRIGALDFQTDPTTYTPRSSTTSLNDMQDATNKFLTGQPFSPDLDAALLHGTSIGGARPKVLLRDATPGEPVRELIAKLSMASDPFPVVKAEAVAMDLARRVGLNVAGTHLTESLGRDVLIVERFDRPGTPGSAPGAPGERRLIISALTMLELDEMSGRYATYHQLADLIRARFTNPRGTLRELFTRIVFNICISNTDDHARNHAAFWDGTSLTLTPAYDLSPQLRSGDTAHQAMAIDRTGNRSSRLATCRTAANLYALTATDADDIIDHQITTITNEWTDAADATRLTTQERAQLWGRQILKPSIHYLD